MNLIPWLKKPKTPEQLEQERQRQLLAQWRMAARKTNLEMLPLRALLRQQCRAMEASVAANAAPMGLCPVPLKRWRRIGKKIANASSWCAKPLTGWLSRRPCLQRCKVALVQWRRRVTVRLALWGLRLLNRR